jgi:DNA repair exonuclease SbcCD ATPase subunit
VILKRLLLYNVGPFLGEWCVEFPEGVTAVVGEYDDRPLASNRAGKSYLAVDAPLYALHGRFRGGADDLVHRLARGVEEGFVELTVESSERTEFTIRRGRSKGGDPIRSLDGSAVKEADLERVVLDEVLGLSYEEHLLTTAFVQGKIHAFMDRTPAEKRRVVSPWFRTDRWIPRYDLARKRLTAAQSKLRAIDAEEGRLRAVVDAGSEARSELGVAEAEERDARAGLESAMEGVAKAKAVVDADVERRERAVEAREEVRRLEAEVATERDRLERAVTAANARFVQAGEALSEANGRREEILRLGSSGNRATGSSGTRT